MSKTKALYHLVFCTKNREMTLEPASRETVYRYITTLIKDMNCVLYRIGGIANHIHLYVDLHPDVALSALMREIKSKSSFSIKQENWAPLFSGWARGYYACTLSPSHSAALIDYINNQEVHHREHEFAGELERLYLKAGLVYYKDDMT